MNKQDLAGKNIVVTAGGTQEPIDPVRHITNRSSGRMGYALAEAAHDRGASVTLITAPTTRPEPPGLKIVRVRTAEEMNDAVMKSIAEADVLIMAAAVSDYRVANPADRKIKKQGGRLVLELVPTPDILAAVPDTLIKVGFAAETEELISNARKKLEQKRLDLIVANDITAADSGFDVETNRVTLIDKSGRVVELPLMSKREVGEVILDRVAGIINRGGDIA